MALLLRTREVGPLQVICYIRGCEATREGLLIDPAAPDEAVAADLEELGLRPRWIVNTHGHADHTAGNDYWAETTGAVTVMHRLDWEFFRTPEMHQAALAEGFPPLTRIGRTVEDGEVLPLGQLRFTVIHTPGHTPGSVCLYTPGHLFTGDTLFVGDAGRTDLPGGSLEALIRSIQEKILPLPPETVVWPGHDYGDTPSSTLREEALTNPYITDFLDE